MGEAIVHGRIRKWGNGYGIQISREELQRLQAEEGAEVTARITTTGRTGFSRFPVFHGPDAHGSRDHDEHFAASIESRKRI